MSVRTEKTTSVGETTEDIPVSRGIPEAVAEDHERLLSVLSRGLAEVGIGSLVTSFHKITLRVEEFHLPERYEPELVVFWADAVSEGIALKVRVAERAGRTFFVWGNGTAGAHPAHDPLGAVAVISEAARAA